MNLERARRRYRPTDMKVLFVAEAPPVDPRRFFYFDRVDKHDWLFLAVSRWLYEEARDTDLPDLRARKPEFLHRFASDGNYLVDACLVPMPDNASPSTKRRLLAQWLPMLKSKMSRLVGGSTQVVLISSAVYQACCDPLRAAGFNVVNTEPIDFPSTGRQKDFARKLGRAMDENLRNAIRDLEESVAFWAPGKANQKARERYVVEHFMRILGINYEPSALTQPDRDPPDVCVQGASFEIKEVQNPRRRRHDEYKQKLAKAMRAERFSDLLERFVCEDMPISRVYARISDETLRLAASKYSAAVRSSLDLLFYFNVDADKSCGVEEGTRPDLQSMRSEGWRSVSFLQGTGNCGVLVASKAAPDFLRANEGRLVRSLVVG